ncbi:hypothetical protein BJ165DRAFT_1499989 [Panaeolus papilionaceus]|nr:hypothetical protein BJ165DRAFT_1499989 [Panaeolus papilionaceus]
MNPLPTHISTTHPHFYFNATFTFTYLSQHIAYLFPSPPIHHLVWYFPCIPFPHSLCCFMITFSDHSLLH